MRLLEAWSSIAATKKRINHETHEKNKREPQRFHCWKPEGMTLAKAQRSQRMDENDIGREIVDAAIANTPSV